MLSLRLSSSILRSRLLLSSTTTFHSSVKRALSITTIHHAGHGPAEPFVGPGAKPGTVPTELEQSTGLERYEYLAELEGRDPFDMKPLEPTYQGTPKRPIIIPSVDDVRYVGCTGFPVDSHDTLWLRVTKETDVDRCPECGCCYQLKRISPPSLENH